MLVFLTQRFRHEDKIPQDFIAVVLTVAFLLIAFRVGCGFASHELFLAAK